MKILRFKAGSDGANQELYGYLRRKGVAFRMAINWFLVETDENVFIDGGGDGQIDHLINLLFRWSNLVNLSVTMELFSRTDYHTFRG